MISLRDTTLSTLCWYVLISYQSSVIFNILEIKLKQYRSRISKSSLTTRRRQSNQKPLQQVSSIGITISILRQFLRGLISKLLKMILSPQFYSDQLMKDFQFEALKSQRKAVTLEFLSKPEFTLENGFHLQLQPT
jgi:hypothetical protein